MLQAPSLAIYVVFVTFAQTREWDRITQDGVEYSQRS